VRECENKMREKQTALGCPCGERERARGLVIKIYEIKLLNYISRVFIKIIII
jgi:hypothetical protein